MKYLRQFESFNERDIHEICKKHHICNYTINEDGSIDVNDDVNLKGPDHFKYFSERPDRKYYEFEKLPLKFNKVQGDFNVNFNKLTTLENCPIEVNGDFYCSNNQLTSLKGVPKKVNRFLCCENKLTTLDECPEIVNGDFNCSDNQLKSLINGPKIVNGYYGFDGNSIYDLYGFPKNHTKTVFFWAETRETPVGEFLSIFTVHNNAGKVGPFIDIINELDIIQGNTIIKDRLIELFNIFNYDYVPTNNLHPWDQPGIKEAPRDVEKFVNNLKFKNYILI